MLGEGTEAPPFRLSLAQGGEESLDGLLASGPVLLAFYKVSCPTCQYAFPFLERLSAGLHTLGIAQDNARAVKEFSNNFGVTFRSAIDDASGGYAVSNAYGITNVPSLFLVEPTGRISLAVKGFSRPDLAGLGERFGVTVFRPGEHVPEFRPG